jgi:hypothetical protein
MNMLFNFDEELEKFKKERWTFEKLKQEMAKKEVKTVNEALKEYKNKVQKSAEKVDKGFNGFLFETFLKQCKISEEEFNNFPEYKQELIRAEFEQRKWK